jgi:uncharacterized protein (TIGR03492 family)
VRRILFVSNGHGESAIAERIAGEVRALAPFPVGLDHLALVGDPPAARALTTVGPRRALPSGGLVAMGNVRAFAHDLRAGFVSLLRDQAAFLRREGVRYDSVVAVGDAYALFLALLAARRTLFVGTAKSVYVARYGPFERTLLRRAARVFVRDEATSFDLRVEGVPSEAPGNVIVDLVEAAPPPPDEFASGEWIGLLPGSREAAYADAVRLARTLEALAARRSSARGLLSLAPGLSPSRFADQLGSAGWTLAAGDGAGVAFRAVSGNASLVGWDGPLGTLLQAATLVAGQAGTANEQAAALGRPVVALDAEGSAGGRRGPGEVWYRMRQRRLLGEALALVAPQPAAAAERIAALLDDPGLLARMRAAGPERMGSPGGARAIAAAILA